MNWTPERKRLALAVGDGLMTFLIVIATFFLNYGFVRWVENNLSHAPDFRRYLVTPLFKAIVAVAPDGWTMMIVLLGVPLGFGYLSYACDEPLITKVYRWLIALCAFSVMAAVSPIMSMHHCLCGDIDQTAWDEVLIPGLVVIFVYYCRRLACRRSKVTGPSFASPPANAGDDAPPSL